MATKTRAISRRVVRQINRVGRRRRSGKRDNRIPLGIVAGFSPVLINSFNNARNRLNPVETFKMFAYTFVQQTTGFRLFGTTAGGWGGWADMKIGLMPIAIGFVTHKLANRFGVNRWLKKMRIPYVKI